MDATVTGRHRLPGGRSRRSAPADAVGSDAPTGGPGARFARSPFWAHSLALALLLALALGIAGTGAVATADEGSYGRQAGVLAEGSWSYPYRFSDIDPDGAWFPYINGDRGPDGHVVYARQPLYPALLSVPARWGWPGWLYVVPVASAWLAANAAAMLARRRGALAARVALWLAGTSVLLVNGTLLWGHAAIAAATGFGLVALVGARAHDRARSVALRCLLAGTLFGVALMFRSEGLLAAAAAAIAWVAAGSLTRDRKRLWVGLASFLAPVVVAEVVLLRWVSSILGGDSAVIVDRTGGGSYLAGRLEGIWHALLAPVEDGPSHQVAAVLGVATVVLAAMAGRAVRARSSSSSRTVALMLLGAAGASLLHVVVARDELVPGLLPAWPIVAFGAGLVDWRARDRGDRLLAVFMLAFALAVVATQYANGGGTQWGGRFFTPIVVPMSALIGGALVHGAVRQALRSPPVLVGLVLLAFVPSVTGVVAVRQSREDQVRVVEAVADAAPTVVTDIRFLPRAAWQHRETEWLLADPGETTDVARRVIAADLGPVAVVTGRGEVPSDAEDVTPEHLVELGVRVLLFRDDGVGAS